MTTKDMLQILIKGLEALTEKQDEFKMELAVLREETKRGFKETHERLDKQGKQLAYLEDDAPTREEHDILVKRVER
ncbi:MAG TPA: hypothetical protein VF810_02100 [Patescibacteria group bacterium]